MNRYSFFISAIFLWILGFLYNKSGIQGLIAFMWIQWRVIKMNWKGFKRSIEGFDRYIFTSTLLMIAGFLTLNLFDDLFIDNLSMLFWLLVGLSFSSYYRLAHPVS